MLNEVFMNKKLNFFPIGDLHIQAEEQSKIFADYLNSREEDYIILLGDVIHFANSFWNSKKDISEEEIIKNIPLDVSIWEGFIGRLRKRTIYFLGSHEGAAFRIISTRFPKFKPKFKSSYLYIPKNLEVLSLGSFSISGLHIPDNIHPDMKSEKFLLRKKNIEGWLTEETGNGNWKILRIYVFVPMIQLTISTVTWDIIP